MKISWIQYLNIGECFHRSNSFSIENKTNKQKKKNKNKKKIKKKTYENEQNMFCEKIFLDTKEINNSLLINDANYQYIDCSSSSLNFVEEDYFEEEVINWGKKHMVDSDDSNDVISSDKNKSDIKIIQSSQALFKHGPIDYVDARPHGNLKNI